MIGSTADDGEADGDSVCSSFDFQFAHRPIEAHQPAVASGLESANCPNASDRIAGCKSNQSNARTVSRGQDLTRLLD